METPASPLLALAPAAATDSQAVRPGTRLRPPVAPSEVAWRDLRADEFWRSIVGWNDIAEATFLDHRWQEKNTVTGPDQLPRLLGDRVSPAFVEEVREGARRSTMAIRVSPYIFSLIDWDDPENDPLRRQFLPMASQLEEDHPLVTLDMGEEQVDSPVPGLTHRYYDRALFITTDRCPVYCRFCTRSYAVGLDTDEVKKVQLPTNLARWEGVFDYVSERIEIEDIVISGGDLYRLKAAQLRLIGERLLAIPHIRRIRLATKGLAVQPMKILTDPEWVQAVTDLVTHGRKIHKEVAIHTHFNHPNEFTKISQDALNLLFERGIPVRNLTVLLKGVNDDPEAQLNLIRRLTLLNIRPYYAYVGDMIRGTEDLRTSIHESEILEKAVRGAVAGHNTPTFVCDVPGGGGKRNLFSYEHYDRETGISVFTAPAVKPGRFFVYADPLRYLDEEVRHRWRNPDTRSEMIDDTVATARARAAE